MLLKGMVQFLAVLEITLEIIERFQTLIVGLLAVLLTFQQVRLLRRQIALAEQQANIMKEQEAIVATQQKQIDAQAQLRVIDSLSTVAKLHHWHLSHQSRTTDLWSVNSVPNVELSTVSDDVIAAAYPERAQEISAAIKAAEKLNSLFQLYLVEPWPVQWPGNEDNRVAAAPRIAEAQMAIACFDEAFPKVRDLAELRS